MRTLETILSREDANRSKIELYREGLFFKAYECSAYLCVEHVARFKPSRRQVKYLGRDIVSVGFPAAALGRYFPGLRETSASALPGDPLVAACCEPVDSGAFEGWKAALPLKPHALPQSAPAPGAPAPGAPVPGEAPAPAAAAVAASVAPAPGEAPAAASEPPGAPAHGYEALARRIRRFRLEAATPLQCMTFIDELKREIDGSL